MGMGETKRQTLDQIISIFTLSLNGWCVCVCALSIRWNAIRLPTDEMPYVLLDFRSQYKICMWKKESKNEKEIVN